MDTNDGHGDPNTDHFHRNEAISAVVDEGFLGEDDDDYEDLYNDVNVGEGFLQSLRKNNDDEVDKKSVPPPVHHSQDAGDVAVAVSGGGGGGGDVKFQSKDEV